MSVVQDKAVNLTTAKIMIKEAAAEGAKLIVLPEMFNCPYDTELFPIYAEEYPQGSTYKMLSETAIEESVYLVGGSMPEKEGSKIYNSSFVFGPQGQLLGRHRKLHLFDIDLPGNFRVMESEILAQGSQATIFETGFGRIGVVICYDLRFPELFRLMALDGVRVVVIPAAFNTVTGPAHWEILLRTRAIDNQMYIIAASPARYRIKSYEVYGYSMMVDPWGEIISKAGEGEQTIADYLYKDRLEEIKSKIPILDHRRTDLYDILKKY